MATKGKPYEKIEFLFTAAQNNSIRTNYIKPKPNLCDKTASGDKDEIISEIVSECNKLA